MHFYGAEVRRARLAAGTTQPELGGVLRYDSSEVSKIEAGIREPPERFAEGCDRAFPSMNGWFTRFYREYTSRTGLTRDGSSTGSRPSVTR
jgi:transcriptional regulator with XRE-family HTH domain